MFIDKIPIRFGNKTFVDVTYETTAGEIFTRREAEIYGKYGVRIYEFGQILELESKVEKLKEIIETLYTK